MLDPVVELYCINSKNLKPQNSDMFEMQHDNKVVS